MICTYLSNDPGGNLQCIRYSPAEKKNLRAWEFPTLKDKNKTKEKIGLHVHTRTSRLGLRIPSLEVLLRVDLHHSHISFIVSSSVTPLRVSSAPVRHLSSKNFGKPPSDHLREITKSWCAYDVDNVGIGRYYMKNVFLPSLGDGTSTAHPEWTSSLVYLRPPCNSLKHYFLKMMLDPQKTRQNLLRFG